MSNTKHFTEQPVEQSVIDGWKEKYGELHCISVPESDEPKKDAEGNELPLESLDGYFRKLSIDEIGLAQRAAMGANGQPDQLKTALVMYNTSLIGGHPAFEKNEDVKRAALNVFKEVIKVRAATIKKV